MMSTFVAETTEPYFQLTSGAIIILLVASMVIRTWRAQQEPHSHTHNHQHESKQTNADHGMALLSIF